MIKAVKLFLKENTTLDLLFSDRSVKRYDVLSLADKFPQLNGLNDRNLFLKGCLIGWGAVVWNDDLDISVETIYEEGKDVSNEYENIENYILGFQIKEKRLELELTQSELAKRIGIDQSDLSKIEKGNANPSIKMIYKIVLGLNSTLTVTIN